MTGGEATIVAGIEIPSTDPHRVTVWCGYIHRAANKDKLAHPTRFECVTFAFGGQRYGSSRPRSRLAAFTRYLRVRLTWDFEKRSHLATRYAVPSILLISETSGRVNSDLAHRFRPASPSCALLTDTGRFKHDLLQAIITGDDDHKVEFAILLHHTSGKSVPDAAFSAMRTASTPLRTCG